MAVASAPTSGTTPLPPRARTRRRTVAWIAGSVGVIFAVLIALLATVGTARDNSPLIGRPAPALVGPSLATGKRVSLAAFAGKWVLVNFAASWCEPCRLEMPALTAFAQAGRRFDASILTVAYDQGDLANLRRYLAGWHASWPAISDQTGQVAYGLGGIPSSYLVDPQGIVVAYYASQVTAGSLEAVISRVSSGSAGGAPGAAASPPLDPGGDRAGVRSS